MKAIPIIFLLTAAVSVAAGSPAAGPAAAAPAGSAEAGGITTASRFLDAELDDHIVDLKRRLAINKQERGPFGLYQIPGKTPILASPLRRKVQQTPFSDYVNKIEISVINAQEKEFLVGARMFRLGQIFPIVGGGERISVRVEAVNPSQVTFKNLDSGEVAARKLNVLPAGVTANAGNIQVQGVTSTRRGEEAPLHLNFNSAPPTP